MKCEFETGKLVYYYLIDKEIWCVYKRKPFKKVFIDKHMAHIQYYLLTHDTDCSEEFLLNFGFSRVYYYSSLIPNVVLSKIDLVTTDNVNVFTLITKKSIDSNIVLFEVLPGWNDEFNKEFKSTTIIKYERR